MPSVLRRARLRPAGTARRRRGRLGDLPVALTFLAPAIACAVLLRLWPTVRAAVDSLKSTPLGVQPSEWVGLEQFTGLFDDPAFINSLKVTALFGVIVNPLQIAIALGLAVLLSERLPGVGLWRTLIFLPIAIPQSVSAVIWGIGFRPDGPVNGTLDRFGIGAQGFLSSPDQALWAVMVIVSWIGIGYWMTFLVAGVKEISPTLYEAVSIDGAGPWRRFRHVTLPGLRRQIAFVLVADTVANLLVFAPVQILTKGGPNGRTDLIMNNVYERAYISGDVGGAAAATVILVLVGLAIVTVQFRLLSRGAQ